MRDVACAMWHTPSATCDRSARGNGRSGRAGKIADFGFHRIKRFGCFRPVWAARLGHVGPSSAAFATKCFGGNPHQLDSVISACQIFRHADRDARFALVRAARHGDDAGADLALAFVDKPAQIFRAYALEDAAAPPAMGGLGDMMGGMGGMPGMPTDPAEYEAAMEQLLDSPMMNEFLGSPEKIEQSRQALLNNPMAMNMMKSMPGFDDIINDKDKFQQRMLESKTQFDAMREAASKDKAAEDAAASEFED